MITTLIIVVHIVVCTIMVLSILLQSGKGADIGAVFGGGSSNTVFGSTGATTFLSKITIIAAVTFMVTSIILSYFAGKGLSAKGAGSVVGDIPAATQPVAPQGKPAEGKASKAQPAQSTNAAESPAKGAETKSTPSGGSEKPASAAPAAPSSSASGGAPGSAGSNPASGAGNSGQK